MVVGLRLAILWSNTLRGLVSGSKLNTIFGIWDIVSRCRNPDWLLYSPTQTSVLSASRGTRNSAEAGVVAFSLTVGQEGVGRSARRPSLRLWEKQFHHGPGCALNR